MRQKKILRFEDDKSRGMYNATSYAHEVLSTDDKHPSPSSDSRLWNALHTHRELNNEGEVGMTSYMSKFFFGFSNIAQLRQWVYRDKWLIGLHEQGIKISEYMCDREDVVIGHTQAMFMSSNSKKTYDILEYFDLK